MGKHKAIFKKWDKQHCGKKGTGVFVFKCPCTEREGTQSHWHKAPGKEGEAKAQRGRQPGLGPQQTHRCVTDGLVYGLSDWLLLSQPHGRNGDKQKPYFRTAESGKGALGGEEGRGSPGRATDRKQFPHKACLSIILKHMKTITWKREPTKWVISDGKFRKSSKK